MADVTGAGASTVPTRADRKRLGAWYTPADLVQQIVGEVVTRPFLARVGERPVRVLDPACGDGRFLRAVDERLGSLGARGELVGVAVAAGAAAAAARRVPSAQVHRADALRRRWGSDRFDLVIGNPPFVSQMAAATTRGGASVLGGGPYADVAAEFLSLAAGLVEPDHGRVAFVLPQSILSARDAGAVRAEYDGRAEMIWSSWSDRRVFDAHVFTCVLAFEFGRPARGSAPWSQVVTGRRSVPSVPDVVGAGTLGDRARLNANFRDEYYGMIPAVGDHDTGPPLVTSGLIDPGVCHWGVRPVTFARQRFAAPRIDVAALDPKMTRWAERRLVPKVLVGNQTRIIEAVCDPTGAWLPAVPVVAVYPNDGDPALAWEIAAVLTSPVASAWAWRRGAGTGMSADAIRLGPVMLADLPWPTGSLGAAVAALRAGDARSCAALVLDAHGITAGAGLLAWWSAILDRIESRHR